VNVVTRLPPTSLHDGRRWRWEMPAAIRAVLDGGGRPSRFFGQKPHDGTFAWMAPGFCVACTHNLLKGHDGFPTDESRAAKTDDKCRKKLRVIYWSLISMVNEFAIDTCSMFQTGLFRPSALLSVAFTPRGQNCATFEFGKHDRTRERKLMIRNAAARRRRVAAPGPVFWVFLAAARPVASAVRSSRFLSGSGVQPVMDRSGPRDSSRSSGHKGDIRLRDTSARWQDRVQNGEAADLVITSAPH